MEKRDWLVMAIGDRMIEPVQLQKLLFLFAQEIRPPEREQYEFVPYNWGPCSFEIYADLEELIIDGLVERLRTDRGWFRYALTQKGRTRFTRLSRTVDKKLLAGLRRRRKWVMDKSFPDLLKAVYGKYPEYAVESKL